MNYTKGPWHVSPTHHNWAEITDAPGTQTRRILATVLPAGNDGDSKQDYSTRNANAFLISAAPELYEALKVMCDGPLLIDDTRPEIQAAREIAMRLYKQATRALAKAEGRL